MPKVPLFARIRKVACFASLLAALVTQMLPWSAFGPGRASGAIQASAIGIPRAAETCIHHPEGCPPDCQCPKLQQDPVDADAGALDGPTLVRCTALGDPVSPPAPAPCLLPFPIAFHLAERSQTLHALTERSTAHGYRPLPAKIPIA